MDSFFIYIYNDLLDYLRYSSPRLIGRQVDNWWHWDFGCLDYTDGVMLIDDLFHSGYYYFSVNLGSLIPLASSSGEVGIPVLPNVASEH